MSNNTSYSANINETHIFSPSVVNEFRAGYARTSPVFGILTSVPLGPRVLFSNGQVATFGSWDGGPQGRIQNTFQYSDTLNWTRGRHTAKVGADFFRYQANSFLESQTRGAFMFLNWDDFAVGRPNAYTQRFGSTARGHRTWIQSSFAQDDFRMTPTLTLNLGFRMEVYGPMSEVNRVSSNLDFNCRKSLGIAGPGPLGCVTQGLNTTRANYYYPKNGSCRDHPRVGRGFRSPFRRRKSGTRR